MLSSFMQWHSTKRWLPVDQSRMDQRSLEECGENLLLVRAFRVHKCCTMTMRACFIQIVPLGITGNVTIDQNGDRNADYSLLDMDPNTGIFHVSTFLSSNSRGRIIQ